MSETTNAESYNFEFAYVVDGVVKSIIHTNEHVANILKSPGLQIVDTTEYESNVLVGYNYDGNSFIVPEDFVMPGDPAPVDDTITPAEEPTQPE